MTQRNTETQRCRCKDAEAKHTMQKCKMQCKRQCTMNTNNWKCQHHQRCYTTKTTVKVCRGQMKTKMRNEKRESVVIEMDNENAAKCK